VPIGIAHPGKAVPVRRRAKGIVALRVSGAIQLTDSNFPTQAKTRLEWATIEIQLADSNFPTQAKHGLNGPPSARRGLVPFACPGRSSLRTATSPLKPKHGLNGPPSGLRQQFPTQAKTRLEWATGPSLVFAHEASLLHADERDSLRMTLDSGALFRQSRLHPKDPACFYRRSPWTCPSITCST
jgi:hypothetical protein